MSPLHASQPIAPEWFSPRKTATSVFKAALLGTVFTGVMLLAQQAMAQEIFKNADGTTTTDLNAAASTWASSQAFVANPSLKALNAHYARAYGYTGAGVRIGLVDTSVYLDHPGFVGSDIIPLTTTGFYSLTGRFPNQVAGQPFTLSAADLTLNYLARDYHGTVMSGFIVGSGNAGYPEGVAPGVTLLVARSIGQNFPTTLPGFDDGIMAASYNALVANGARAINGEWQVGKAVTSWARLGQLYNEYPTSGLLGAMQNAAEKGVLVTMPNGNFSSLPGIGSALPYFRPQLENSWISVAATDNGKTLASFSNVCGEFTKWWCVTATSFGNSVNYSPLPTRADSPVTPTLYRSRGGGGTSEASAEAVGALGVVMQRYPYLGNYEIRDILLTTATPLDKTGVSNNSGFGLVNLATAMNGPGQLLGKFNASLPGGVTDIWSNNISEAALLQRKREEARELAGLRTTTLAAYKASLPAVAAAAPGLLATLLSTVQAGNAAGAVAALDAARANPVAKSFLSDKVLSADFRRTLTTLSPNDPGFNDFQAFFLPTYRGPLSPSSYTDTVTAMVNDYALRSSYLESKTAADYQNSFTKSGAGTLVLTGQNTYTGPTEVAGGLLVINGSLVSSVMIDAGAALSGIGAVGSTTVAAGGALVPGSAGTGTLTVNGSLAFASGAFYLVSGTSSGFSSVKVTGTAALNGNMVVAVPQSLIASLIAIPNATTVLTSAGLNNTRFSSVNTSFAALAGDLTYSATDVRLAFSSGFSRISGLNANQTAVGSAIDKALNGGATLPASFASVMTSATAQNLPSTLSALSGEAHASSAVAITQGMNAFLTTILDPSIETRSTGLGAALGYAPQSQAEKKAKAFAQFGMAPNAVAATDPSRFSIWGSSYGAQGTVNGNAATGSRTTTSRIYGTAAGLDYRLTPDTFVGFSLGGGTASWGLSDNAGSGGSDLFHAGLYGKTQKGPTYLSAALAYGWSGVTSYRNVSVLGNDRLVETFDATNVAARLEAGSRIAMPLVKLPGFAAADAGLTPYAAIRTQAINIGGSNERPVFGSNQFALSYGSQSLTPTRSELGTRYDSLFRLGSSTDLLLRARLAWAHDFDNDNRATALFQALSTAVFTTNGAAPATDGALVSAGAEMRFRNGIALAAKFDGEFSSTTTIYAGTVTARYHW